MKYHHFPYIFIEILDRHASVKRKYLRANQGRFMTKDLHNAIMKHCRLRNNRNVSKRIQKTFAWISWKKPKTEHFANVDVNSVSGIKKFWQIVKPHCSNKVKAKTTIRLVENNEMIDDEIEISKLTSIS